MKRHSSRSLQAYHAWCAEGLPEDWNQWLEAQGVHAGYCQTTHWLAIDEAVNGAKHLALWVEDSSDRLLAALMSFGATPRYANTLKSRMAAIVSRQDRSLVCHDGPALASRLADPKPVIRELLHHLADVCGSRGIGSWRFSGMPVASDAAERQACSAAEAFADAGFRISPWQTAIVDLQVPDLPRSFKHSVRKSIRKAQKNGLKTVRCETYEDFAAFRAAFLESVALDGGTPRSTKNDRDWWQLDGGKHYDFFTCVDGKGSVHATLGTYCFNGVVTEVMSGRTKIGRWSSVPAQDVLHHDLMMAHRARGCKWFDLAGFSPDPATPKEEGIRRFKQKWGGVDRRRHSFNGGRQMPVLSLLARARTVAERR